MISNVSLAAARISISAFNTATVAEWDPMLGGSGGAMVQDGGRWGSRAGSGRSDGWARGSHVAHILQAVRAFVANGHRCGGKIVGRPVYVGLGALSLTALSDPNHAMVCGQERDDFHR
jgi:hypothetical protein